MGDAFIKGMISPDRVREIQLLAAKIDPIIGEADALVEMGLLAYLVANWLSRYEEDMRGDRFVDFSELCADLSKSLTFPAALDPTPRS